MKGLVGGAAQGSPDCRCIANAEPDEGAGTEQMVDGGGRATKEEQAAGVKVRDTSLLRASVVLF